MKRVAVTYAGDGKEFTVSIDGTPFYRGPETGFLRVQDLMQRIVERADGIPDEGGTEPSGGGHPKVEASPLP